MTRRTLRKTARDTHKRKSLWFALLALVSCHDDQPASSDEARPAHHSVRLIDPGTSKIATIKAIREVTGLGLQEAKHIADTAPALLWTGSSEEAARAVASTLEGAGAKVEIQRR